MQRVAYVNELVYMTVEPVREPARVNETCTGRTVRLEPETTCPASASRPAVRRNPGTMVGPYFIRASGW
jgi:hypothetical protein